MTAVVVVSKALVSALLFPACKLPPVDGFRPRIQTRC